MELKLRALNSPVDVWRYGLHIVEHQSLPANYAVGKNALTSQPLGELVYPWDLEILVRELLLNATRMGTRSLRNWSELAEAVSFIRRLEGVAYEDHGAKRIDILFELHRLGQRQFSWQTDHGARPMIRALKVFGEAAVEAIFVRNFGMTLHQFLLLGLAINGNFLTNPVMSINQDVGAWGISREASDAFFKRVTCSLEQIRADIRELQSYDQDWLYTWNPLRATPLVIVSPTSPDLVLCPIPRYLTLRISSGIFYDLVTESDFDNPFGRSFQRYIGDVIKATCPPPKFTARPEHSYSVGTQNMHGVDWVLSDCTGHLFIECKAKRLRLNSQMLLDSFTLDKDLAIMAKAIVQHYRNICDALEGKTTWMPNGLPIFPMVLTLEDWLIFSPRIHEMLNEKVRQLLANARVPEQILEDMPYTIASAHEFEIASQVIEQVGISPLMAKKTASGRWGRSLLPFVSRDFSDEMRRVNWHLFEDDWDKLVPTHSDN